MTIVERDTAITELEGKLTAMEHAWDNDQLTRLHDDRALSASLAALREQAKQDQTFDREVYESEVTDLKKEHLGEVAKLSSALKETKDNVTKVLFLSMCPSLGIQSWYTQHTTRTQSHRLPNPTSFRIRSVTC